MSCSCPAAGFWHCKRKGDDDKTCSPPFKNFWNYFLKGPLCSFSCLSLYKLYILDVKEIEKISEGK